MKTKLGSLGGASPAETPPTATVAHRRCIGPAGHPHLPWCVPRVPQRVPQVLARPRGGVHHLEGHAGVAIGPCRLVLPVGLRHLLPHHHVEAAA